MQRSKTVEFWNQHHERKTNQEWIVHPSSNSLVQKIIPLLLPILSQENTSSNHNNDNNNDNDNSTNNDNDNGDDNNDDNLSVLEIGCGSSQLSKEIYNTISKKGRFVVTDVSPICIQTNIKRDEVLINESNGNFNYQVLDATVATSVEAAASIDSHNVNTSTNNNNNHTTSKFHIILDKGCLDTFLFRSERKKQNAIVEKLLNRVHTWMTNYYIVISPRSKSKVLRDFQGFDTVERCIIDDHLADLEGMEMEPVTESKLEEEIDSIHNLDQTTSPSPSPSSAPKQQQNQSQQQQPQNQVYLYICTKNKNYIPGKGPAFIDSYQKDADIDANNDLESICNRCGITYENFCQKFSKDLSLKKKNRQWKGHRLHCKK